VVEVLDTPAQTAVRRDRVDGALEAEIADPIACARLEREVPVAPWAPSALALALLVFAVVTAVDADHASAPGRRPRPSMKIRSHDSSMASVHSRSPIRRRRVSFGSFRPCRSRPTYASWKSPRAASAR